MIPRLSATERLVLSLLARGNEMFGLEMLHANPKLKRGTIYVVLGRMIEKGFLTSRECKEERTPGLPRRFYRITGLGLRMLTAADAYERAIEGDFAYV